MNVIQWLLLVIDIIERLVKLGVIKADQSDEIVKELVRDKLQNLA